MLLGSDTVRGINKRDQVRGPRRPAPLAPQRIVGGLTGPARPADAELDPHRV